MLSLDVACIIRNYYIRLCIYLNEVECGQRKKKKGIESNNHRK